MPAAIYRPCWAEIDTAALRHNFQALRGIVGPSVQILAVVKANAYGHGLVEAARLLDEAGVPYLGVSSIEEGVALRKAGLRTPVLVLGTLYPFDNFPVLFDHKLTATIASLEAAEALNALARQRHRGIPVHLKIDSGFGRIGVSETGAGAFLDGLKNLPHLTLEGIYTHFADSDGSAEYTAQQAKTFRAVVQTAEARGFKIPLVHLANSAAILRFPDTYGSMVRPGLALYGVVPAGIQGASSFQPVLSWKTRVIFIKTVSEGSSISYNRTWTAKRPSRIATLAVGYADGFLRALSNQGQVLIRGGRAPVVGRVTMDMTMVDVTDLRGCHVGDEAVLIGTQNRDRISANDLAGWAGTNAYETLCAIGARVPRVYR